MKRGVNDHLLVPTAEIAHSMGVKPESVAEWAKRHRQRRKRGGRNFVSPEAAEKYMQLHGLERVAKKPRGWWTIKGMVLECGVGRQPVKEAIEAGKLRAVVHSRNIYVHPEDAKRFMLEYTTNKPMKGWVLVPDLRDELGRSKEALNNWIRHNTDVEVRHFLHPTRNRVTPYIREADAERYRQVVRERGDRHVGYTWKSGERTRKRVVDAILARGNVPTTTFEIAADLNISNDTVHHTATLLVRAGVLERTGRGVKNDRRKYRVARTEEATAC